jgi:hypothetical protein
LPELLDETDSSKKKEIHEPSEGWIRCDVCLNCKEPFLHKHPNPTIQWEGKIPPQVKGKKSVQELNQQEKAWKILKAKADEEIEPDELPFISFLLLYLTRARFLVLRRELSEKKGHSHELHYEMIRSGEMIQLPPPITLSREELLSLEIQFSLELDLIENNTLE